MTFSSDNELETTDRAASNSSNFVSKPALELNQPFDPNALRLTPDALNFVNLSRNIAEAVVQIQVANTHLTGSAEFLTPQGHLATKYHVIQGANPDQIYVTYNGQKRKATIELTDVEHDLAILKIDSNPFEIFPVCPMSARTPNGNESMFAVGYPQGVGEFISRGNYLKTSSLGRLIEDSHDTTFQPLMDDQGHTEFLGRAIEEFKEHIEPGCSGGAQFDLSGHMLGNIDMKGVTIGNNIPDVCVATPAFDIMIDLQQALEKEHTRGISMARSLSLNSATPTYDQYVGNTNALYKRAYGITGSDNIFS